jgi:Tol biopolymer transport system component
LFAAVALGLLFYLLNRNQPGGRTAPPFDRSKIARLTTTGRSLGAVISPDGKLVAHIVDEAGKQSLYIRQVTATGNTQVIPPDDGIFKGLEFSLDGDFLYYVKGFRGNPVSTLYKVPSLGGSPPVKVLDDVDSPISFSPDGKRFAFVRGYPKQSEIALLLINVDGTDEQKLAVYKGGSLLLEPAWSPDGKTIACSARKLDGGFRIEVVAFQVSDGSERTLGDKKWAFISGVDWVSDGKSLLVTAREQTGGAGPIQVYEIPYPEGPTRKVTNDLNNYGGISLTADSSAMVTVQVNTTANLWVAPGGDSARVQQVTTGSGLQAYVSFAPDGRILYVSDASGNYDIWIMDADGKNQRQLTSDGGINIWPSVSPDNRYVIFASNRGANAATFHLWRMNLDGSSPKQLTTGEAEYWPVCSADSKWVIFTRMLGAEARPMLWKVPIEGGDAVQVTNYTALQSIVSPDGKSFACWYAESPQTPAKLAIIPMEGGQPTKILNVPPSIGEFVNIRWTPDGKAISYLDSKDGIPNVWNQPIDGGKPVQVTNFNAEKIFNFDWSRDGKQLGLARGKTSTDVILIRDEGRGANTQQSASVRQTFRSAMSLR